MNKNLLQKCLDELAKDSPKLDYVRGILETLIALSEKEISVISVKPAEVTPTFQPPKQIDEAASLEAAAAAAMKKIPSTLEV